MTLLGDALLATAAVVVGLTLLVGYRAVRGPTVQDRAIAINAMGTTTIVVIALVAAAFDEPGFLDVALVYALLNFLLSIALSTVVVEREGERGGVS
jgi:multicomponent Na+:H+ antiporter subunit F